MAGYMMHHVQTIWIHWKRAFVAYSKFESRYTAIQYSGRADAVVKMGLGAALKRRVYSPRSSRQSKGSSRNSSHNLREPQLTVQLRLSPSPVFRSANPYIPLSSIIRYPQLNGPVRHPARPRACRCHRSPRHKSYFPSTPMVRHCRGNSSLRCRYATASDTTQAAAKAQ